MIEGQIVGKKLGKLYLSAKGNNGISKISTITQCNRVTSTIIVIHINKE